MHQHDLSAWTPSHDFDRGNRAAERSTRQVLWITLIAMAVEIAAGLLFNSMALLADGWHMSSHALAIGLTVFAYAAARRYARDPRFAFGTWKIEVLAGYSSALALIGVALMMVFGSVERLLSPQPIRYLEAIAVAVFGLIVNLYCARLLGHAHHHGDDAHVNAHDHPPHDHHHDHDHDHGHGHGQEARPDAVHDLNLRGAYLHVLADAATSVLAILALLGGWWADWGWLDPLIGLLGAVLVALWSRRLLIDTAKVLLDREMDHPLVEAVRRTLESGPERGDTRIADLHLWRVGRTAYALTLSVVTHDDRLGPAELRAQLGALPQIVHATIEVHVCADREQPAAGGS